MLETTLADRPAKDCLPQKISRCQKPQAAGELVGGGGVAFPGRRPVSMFRSGSTVNTLWLACSAFRRLGTDVARQWPCRHASGK